MSKSLGEQAVMPDENLDLFANSGNIVFDGADLGAKYYKSSSSEALVMVFISAGNSGRRGRDEFKASLDKYSTSLIFVNDYEKLWYNTTEIHGLFSVLNGLSGNYRNVAALGESMGGCGAILATRFIPSISRVLSFSPQFSIKPPFIEFDEYYRDVGRERLNNTYEFSNYGQHTRLENCQLLYGNNIWQDYIHQAMYQACGFSVFNTMSPHHSISSYLKHHAALEKLLDAFMNFDVPWNAVSIQTSILPFLTSVKLRFESQECRSVKRS
jgi:hypothetical protein